MPLTSRRSLLRVTAFGVVAASVGGAAALRPAAAAEQPPGVAGTVNEIYRGRHIRVAGGAAWIDGRQLHVMVTPDGRYLSAVNHYRRSHSPLEAARSAVDLLRGHRLRQDHHHP
jgi:hypothetical protein